MFFDKFLTKIFGTSNERIIKKLWPVVATINDLEAGRVPEDVGTTRESLPTPVPRLPHEGDVEPEETVPQAGPTPRKKRSWRPDRGPERGSDRGPERGRGGPGPGARPTKGSSTRRPR